VVVLVVTLTCVSSRGGEKDLYTKKQNLSSHVLLFFLATLICQWNLPFTPVLSYEPPLLRLFDRKEWVRKWLIWHIGKQSHSRTFGHHSQQVFQAGLFSAQKTHCEFSKSTMTSSVCTYITICHPLPATVAVPAARSIAVSIFVRSLFSVMWVFPRMCRAPVLSDFPLFAGRSSWIIYWCVEFYFGNIRLIYSKLTSSIIYMILHTTYCTVCGILV
jgi:hypothetical protein